MGTPEDVAAEKKSYPSDNQIREFWERCGLIYKEYPRQEVANSCEAMYLDERLTGWYQSGGKLVSYRDTPKLDLNNLFKYAVPKVIEEYRIEIYIVQEDSAVSIFKGTALVKFCCLPRLEDALFLAIWEMIK